MYQFFTAFWSVLAEMSPYLLLGFLIAGVLSVWVPKRIIQRHLGGRGIWSATKSALLGVPLPLCSCGVIPVSAGLREHGASKGATNSFLIATPQTGVDSILVTYSLMGPVLAIYRPLAALVTGIIGGGFTDWVERSAKQTTTEEQSAHQRTGQAEKPALLRMLHYGFIGLPRSIASSLIIGLLIAALIGALIPPDYLADKVSGVWAFVAMLAISVPLYVCSTGSVPVAVAMIHAGVSPGAALVFLIAGPATNAATITTIARVLGIRSTLVYLGTLVIGAIISGIVLNVFFGGVVMEQVHAHGMASLTWFHHVSAVAMLLIIGYALLPTGRRKVMSESSDLEHTTITVEGMTCDHCRMTVENTLLGLDGVEQAKVSLRFNAAVVAGHGLDVKQLITVINKQGFKASKHKCSGCPVCELPGSA